MHWYHKRNGRVERYRPLKANGEEYQRINEGKALADGAVKSVTYYSALCQSAGWLSAWYGGIGLTAGLRVGIEAGATAQAGLMDEPGAVETIAQAYNGKAKDLYTQLSTEAADAGTEIHDAIDAYLSGGELSENPIHATAQTETRAWLEGEGVIFPVRSEHAVMFKGMIGETKAHYGGTADLISHGYILDWKTVEPNKNGRYRDPKPSECIQLAALRHAAHQEGLCREDARCVNVYLSRDTGHIVNIMPWTEKMLDHGLAMLALAFEAERRTALIQAGIKRKKGG